MPMKRRWKLIVSDLDPLEKISEELTTLITGALVQTSEDLQEAISLERFKKYFATP